MNSLEPLTYPFTGVQAIEASAGTGKTWTIEALYLRLLLGHGCDARNPREILVVTFTNAATEELQNRIRARIAAATRVFRGDADAGDAFLHGLRDAFDADEHERCAQALELAMQWMDDAAIHTIHGWCHKVLQRFPLASDSLGAFEVSDDDELSLEVLRDYWRMNCLELPAHEHALFSKDFAQPEDLLGALRERVPQAGPGDALATELVRERAPRWQALAESKRRMIAEHEDFVRMLDAARTDKQIRTRKLGAANVTRWMDRLIDWARDETGIDTKVAGSGLGHFAPGGLTDAWQTGTPPVEHPFVQALTECERLCAELRDGLAALVKAHAAAWCLPRLEALKRRRGIAASDDLVTRVADALDGGQGAFLAARLRDYHPVALVDEFQDTDPDQWRIFSAVWQGHESASLTLIGDPKQSIYAFRGADVEAYLDARDTAHRIWKLDTNYRSSHAMVAAVNRVFSHADRFEAGAFLHGGRIRFVEMAAHGRSERFIVHGTEAPALTFWHDPVERNGDACRATLARVCAWEIHQLLSGVHAGFEDADGFTTVQARDIAVLVRNWREAEAVRRALAAHDIRSVYLSERDSVYASAEARQVLQLLHACAWPRDERLVRSALAQPLLRRPLAELGAVRDDETALERTMQRFLGYHGLWRERGVLSVLYRIAHDFRLIESGAGDRELTNYLHLADLLQNEAAQVDGEPALLRLLAEQVETAGAAQSGEEHVVRLESDDEVVRVVTVFKSKGLEYPLVFLPFATAPPPKANEIDEAQRAEAQRLLYVALTRARHAVWAGAVPTTYSRARATHTGLLGHALGGGASIAPDELAARLVSLRGDADSIALVPLPEAGTGRLAPAQPPAPKPARVYAGAPREAWWVGSYSALELGPRRYRPVESALEKQLDDADEEAPGAASADAPIHRIARGAETGNFLHKLLEWAAATGFAHAAVDAEARRQEISRRIRHRFEPGEAEVFDRWLEAILVTPLPAGDQEFALADLSVYRSELEFWFGARTVDAQRLDDRVTRAILPGEARPGVRPDVLNGMLKGYIDLVFEHDGRYFVADFKSNALGDDDAAYTRDAMAVQLLKKRYDLQLSLYTLALHRLLKVRLADYDYDRHVGGALYLYLRGIHEPERHGVFVLKPPHALVEALDALFDGVETDDVA